MQTNQEFILRFDRFYLPVNCSAIKKFIIDELERLSKETGYPLKSLKIEFYSDAADRTLAYFAHYPDVPIGFFFNLSRCSGRSANQIIDICRHEFAHYVVFMKSNGRDFKKPHGTMWKKACKKLGAKPCAYASNEITKHIFCG